MTMLDDRAVDLERENTGLRRQLEEAYAQQSAITDILGIICSSPDRLQPVFDAVLVNAVRLCAGSFGMLALRDGDGFRGVAVDGVGPEFREALTRLSHPPPGTGLHEMAQARLTTQVADCAAERAYDRVREVNPAFMQVRTALHVPMLREDELLGAILIFRDRVLPFDKRQIGLLESFAKQAVIAMEDARLITETREALKQQTATAEVLQVINSSPGDLAPVFDAMLEKATDLCDAASGVLWVAERELFRAVASRGVTPSFEEFLRSPVKAGPDTGIGRLGRGEQVAHVTDMAAAAGYGSGDPLHRAAVDLAGIRSLLAVPLQKDGVLLGAFGITRLEVRPFTDKQIALLQNFAAQAVIAMENARLITETREALEQQTATADILRVISNSTTDIDPVFEAIVERAAKLCDAEFAGVARYDDDGLLHLVATSNLSPEEAAAFHNLFPRRPDPGFVMGRAFLLCEPVVIEDVLTDPSYDRRTQGNLLSVTRYRTFMGMPIMREGRAIGVIGCARRQIRAFTPAQVELVRTFADQAVIAIENARLLSELRDREAELRVTFDNMADAVAMFDEALHLAAWNRNFQKLLQLPEDFLGERPGFDRYIRYLSERGEFGETEPETEIARLRARLRDHYSFERTRPDGTVIEVRHNPMPDGGVILIYSDITERKRSEIEIREARDAAQSAYRDLKAAQANLIQAEKMASLGQLTAGIAHEIKNPLNFVNNFASLSNELLSEVKEIAAPAIAALDEDTRAELDQTIEMLSGNLEKITEHGKRADNIVKSMLEHSRGVGGERRAVDLNALVDEALNLAYHGARARDPAFNITLERDFDAALAPLELAPQDITRVFLNLFGNGFYAAHDRARASEDAAFCPMLRVETRDAGDAVEITVRDNGAGIPSEIKDKLFQPFFTTKPTGEGTGLGLSISYDIVTQQHGGTITVDSEPEAFTEFTVRLPRNGGTALSGRAA